MKFTSRSLAGQLTLLLLITLGVAQGVAVALFAWESIEAARHAHRDNAVVRTATVARLLGDTPPGLHASVIAAASTELTRFSLTGEPVIAETGSGEHAATIARDLSAALGTGPERVRVAPPWMRLVDDGHDDDHDDDGDHEDHGHHDDEGSWELDWFTASVELEEGPWLNVTVGPPPGVPQWGLAFVLTFLLTALGIAAVAVVMGWRIVKPMRGLANAAGRLGRGEAVDDLPEAGPEETRETIRAYRLPGLLRPRFRQVVHRLAPAKPARGVCKAAHGLHDPPPHDDCHRRDAEGRKEEGQHERQAPLRHPGRRAHCHVQPGPLLKLHRGREPVQFPRSLVVMVTVILMIPVIIVIVIMPVVDQPHPRWRHADPLRPRAERGGEVAGNGSGVLAAACLGDDGLTGQREPCELRARCRDDGRVQPRRCIPEQARHRRRAHDGIVPVRVARRLDALPGEQCHRHALRHAKCDQQQQRELACKAPRCEFHPRSTSPANR